VQRRYGFNKRTFENQDLGPFVNHEMNRCIQCYRCVRFYQDYAGGTDFAAMGTRNLVYFGRHQDGRLESEFSGNLVEVCPTGVFTDKTQRDHYVRKWDLQTAPSICVHCGLGCNTIPGERYGMLRRIRNRYNGAVNGYFLCDRGRFGYEFVNADTRIRQVVSGSGLDARRQGDDPAAAVAGMIRRALASGGRVAGIGSPRASLEANYALRRLVGADSFYLGVMPRQQRLLDTAINIFREGPSRSCSLRELEKADAMLILGEDVTNTAPMLDYSLRQWLRRRPTPEQIGLSIPEWNDAAVGEIVHETPSPLYIATVNETKLDRLAAKTYRAAPRDLARLGYAVAHLLDDAAPDVSDLSTELFAEARQMAEALARSKRPIIVSGLSTGSEQVLRAAANVAWSLQVRCGAAEICIAVPECNSLGLGLLGGRPLSDAYALADDPGIEVLIVLENDLYRRAPQSTIDHFLRGCRHVVVLDHTESPTTAAAEVVLPAATFAESSGTLVNNEGRAQRYYSVMVPEGDVRQSWEWLTDIRGRLAGASPAETPVESPAETLDSLSQELAREVEVFAPLPEAAPPASFRIAGMKIARQPHRYSGRAAMTANEKVFELAPPEDRDSPLAYTMEGFHGWPPAPLVPRIWSPGWNSPQALNKGVGPGNRPDVEDAGIRLLEPAGVDQPPHFLEIPSPFSPIGEGTYIVPVHHIFGSEEMSMHSPRFPEVAPSAYVGLNRELAESLEAVDDDLISVRTDDLEKALPARIMDSLPPGVVVIPVGLRGLEGINPPFAAKITKVPHGHRQKEAESGQSGGSDEGADATGRAGHSV
jgi:NADH-quinone oxidoreductase subunit G